MVRVLRHFAALPPLVLLRGDGMWYYAYARSLAFDRDLDFRSTLASSSSVARNRFSPQHVSNRRSALEPWGMGAGLRNSWTGPRMTTDPYLHDRLAWVTGARIAPMVLSRNRLRAPPVRCWEASCSGTSLISRSIHMHPASSWLLFSSSDGSAVRRGPRISPSWDCCSALRHALDGRMPSSAFSPCGLSSGWCSSAHARHPAGAHVHAAHGLEDPFRPFLRRTCRWVNYMRCAEVLFSSRHGLFSWSPILLFATVGLLFFLR